jgi:hypothetical protein
MGLREYAVQLEVIPGWQLTVQYHLLGKMQPEEDQGTLFRSRNLQLLHTITIVDATFKARHAF